MKLTPHFEAISDSFRVIAKMRDTNESANLLMRHYLASWDFDEDWYLNAYPDLGKAIADKAFADGFTHFVTVGYYEGRLPIQIDMDDDWYLATYPDVANAIIQGVMKTPEEHFMRNGYREGRLPGDPGI